MPGHEEQHLGPENIKDEAAAEEINRLWFDLEGLRQDVKEAQREARKHKRGFPVGGFLRCLLGWHDAAFWMTSVGLRGSCKRCHKYLGL